MVYIWIAENPDPEDSSPISMAHCGLGAQAKRNDELQATRAANRVVLAEVRSEAKTLSAQHKELLVRRPFTTTVS